MRLFLAALGLSMVGCPASDTYGTAGTQGGTAKSPTVGAAGAGGHSSSSGTGSSGASSSGSSGTTGDACGDAWVTDWYDGGYLPTAGDCPPGQVELKGRLVNACGFNGFVAPPLTIPFTAIDASDPSITATTGPCGVFKFCVDAGTQLTPSFLANGFFPGQLATLDLAESAGRFDDEGISGLLALCDQLVNGGTAVTPALDPGLALVLVSIEEEGPTAPCDDDDGWTFTLYGPDGGALDPPYFFVNTILPSQSDGGTGTTGAQMFYNLDPALVSVEVKGARPGNVAPDGGQVCPERSTIDAQFTGVVPLVPAEISYFLYLVP